MSARGVTSAIGECKQAEFEASRGRDSRVFQRLDVMACEPVYGVVPCLRESICMPLCGGVSPLVAATFHVLFYTIRVKPSTNCLVRCRARSQVTEFAVGPSSELRVHGWVFVSPYMSNK